jgi:HlyD family secretion protein
MEQMDRPIDRDFLTRRRLRRTAVVAAAVAALVAAVVVVRGWIRPSLRLDRIRIATVEKGPVEAAILCSGTVTPAAEQVIPCPFDARVLRVLEEPGATLRPGQALVELDSTEVRLGVARLQDRIALAQSRRRELGLDLERQLSELRGQSEIQQERLAFLEAKTEQQRELHGLGLTTVYELRQAELDERIARIELRQLGETEEKVVESTQAQIEGLEIETSLLRRDLEDQQQRLERAVVRADRAGVLTWIAEEEGATLREGSVIARWADLSRFRVRATLSDLHANHVAVGMPVRVEIGEEALTGQVSSIPPTLDEGLMTINVDLDDPSSELLHSNLRVDVHVITETRPMTLRIAKGPFVNGTGRQQVFVVRDDVAMRTSAVLGAVGIDHYEVLTGLEEGDRVIVSAMRDFMHLERIRLR